MDSMYESIIESSIFKFVVGSRKKEYSIHSAALSGLSRPLEVLLNGPLKEAQELRVEWPDVDEKTFVRFIQWAYTQTYIPEEPEIILDQSNVGIGADVDKPGAVELPLYCLTPSTKPNNNHCRNATCSYYKEDVYHHAGSAACLVCRRYYSTNMCSNCNAAFADCPHCNNLLASERTTCSSPDCRYFLLDGRILKRKSLQVQCPKCMQSFSTKACSGCSSASSDCPRCNWTDSAKAPTKRGNLIDKFLDKTGSVYATSSSVYVPRKNTEGCEDYSGVFLCHAKLYVLGDIYDVPKLRQLSLHRLHSTLKEFTLYPSRLNDISTLAKYVFENTRSGDKIQDMITLYYACIIEDASKHEGLKSLVDEAPDFAHGLILRMSERLA